MKNHCRRLNRHKLVLLLCLLCWAGKSIYVYAESASIFQQISPIELHLDSVRTLIGTQQYEAALTHLQTLSAIDSPELHVQYELLLGTIYFHQGLYERSLGQLEYTLGLHGKQGDLLHADLLNQIGHCYLRFVELDQAQVYYQKALKIRKKLLGTQHEKVGNIYNNLGLISEQKGLFEKALAYYNSYLSIMEDTYGKGHQELVDPLTKVGDIYKMRMNYAVAKTYFDKALAIASITYGPNHINTAQVYFSLSDFFGIIGNTKKEISYLSKSIVVFESVYGTNHPAVKYLNHLKARGLIGMERYDQALTILNDVKQFAEERNDIYLAGIAYEYLGQIFSAQKNHTQAAFFNEKALRNTVEQSGREHTNTFSLLLNQGSQLVENSQPRKGLEKLEEAKAIGASIFNDDPRKLWKLYLELGLCFTDLKEWDNAASYLLQAREVHADKQRKASYVFANLLEIDLAFTKLALASYQHDKKAAPLYIVVDTLLPAIEEKLFYLKSTFQSIGTGQSLTDQFYDFYQYAIEINYALYEHSNKQLYLEKAFEYSEKSKASILMQTLQNEEAVSIAGIPDSIIHQINKLVANIAFTEKEIYELSEQDSSILIKKRVLQNSLFDLQKQYETLLTKVEQNYPSYYHLKYANQSISITDLQQKVIRQKESLIEYFIGDSMVYIFIVDVNEFKVLRFPKSDEFEDQVHQFRNSIISYEPLGDNDSLMQVYADLGWLLYEQLIAPIKNQLHSDVCIIANDVLEYLPFDALLMQPNKDFLRVHAFEYLLNDHAITYAYSATWLSNAIQKNSSSFEETYLGIAPRFSTANNNNLVRAGLSELKFNTVEVEETAKFFGGDTQLGAIATKSAFKEVAANYKILHLATHGKSNNVEGDFSYLAFANTVDTTDNGLLYVKDLLTLDLPTELVVLSACETGIGAIQKGEGVVSVGKGCSYAGAKSILSTLWTINDNSTAKLIPLFFKELYQGVSKGRALQAAKKAFIRGNRDAHPYYWSGCLLYGDPRRLTSSNSFFTLNSLTTSLGIGSLFFLMYLFFKRKKISPSHA